MAKYRDYFQINESYFPAVNEDVIKTQPEVWKSYYPHDSFIGLLNQTVKVLTGRQRMNIWVEGAYGTGKSHAVLTLKKLIDCSNDELKEYFDKYHLVFKTDDLYNELYSLKNQDKKILTVHRYGSSNIRNDHILMNAVQSSIIESLKEHKFSYLGQVGIKDAMIAWLEKPANLAYFDNIIREPKYLGTFASADGKTILENLKNYKDENAIQALTEKISYVGESEGIKPFVLEKESLRDWILDVIERNRLKAILFIWDEFSDYFDINKGDLSGFQYLAEISETNPFYFVIVTHKSSIFFENSRDDVKTKINGRFISPHCTIELPDNMAFKLTAHAMQKTSDPLLLKDWNESVLPGLIGITNDSRNEVRTYAKLSDEDLEGVLPIHPYAALILKNIATVYESNQRSMFDFIKNNQGDDIQGFQWFIENYGPDDDNPLLTVDMLWSFFYEKGKDKLAPQIRSILDVYDRTGSYELTKKEKKVLKTVLLLQAINERIGDVSPLFIPNDRNLRLAFDGTDLSGSNVISIANTLVNNQILFKRPMGGGKEKYSALVSSGSQEEIDKLKEQIKNSLLTDKLLEEGSFADDFKVPKNLSLRYRTSLLTRENIMMRSNEAKSEASSHPNKLFVAFTFAKNAEESGKIREEIKKQISSFDRIVYVDYSGSYLSDDMLNQYVENRANSRYQSGKDNGLARNYDNYAKSVIVQWKQKVFLDNCRIYSVDNPDGIQCGSIQEVQSQLLTIDKEKFPLSEETNLNVIDTMYDSNSLRTGALCGINREVKSQYRSSNDNTKLELQFGKAWQVDDYWKIYPQEYVSKLKKRVEDVIKSSFDKSNRVSIGEIYDSLSEAPFGLMPCNLTAFILGFVLKEYASDSFNCSDDLTTVPMSSEKLAEIITSIIKDRQTPSNKYRDQFIVEMSPEQREFNKASAFIFNLDEDKCVSIDATRMYIRSAMSQLKFPIWSLKYCTLNTKTPKNQIDHLLDCYVNLANNSGSGKSETDIAIEIGNSFINNSDLRTDMKQTLTQENCVEGMKKYLESYQNGALPKLADKINDSGSYLNKINQKFSTDSNWVWNKNTVDQMIDDTILEYEIIAESNEIIPPTETYDECLHEWAKKCESLKVSYNAIKSDGGELSALLSLLYMIAKNGNLYESEKTNFLECLTKNKEQFQTFCAEQNSILRKTESFYFKDLTNEDVSEIGKKISGVYTLENAEYTQRIEQLVTEYKSSQAKYKLSQLWKEKTGTKSPEEWSFKYSMPIFALIPGDEQARARVAFNALNTGTNDKSQIEDAMDYISSFKHFDDLNSPEKRDQAFRKYMLGNYSTLFDDLAYVKDMIKDKCPSSGPYYWLEDISVKEAIKNLAYSKYINGGNEKVNSVIDSMSDADLKRYLKELVKENVTVGIEIIKNKK
ncbi:MAG: hypothetical protein PUE07_05195 [bacterium]|nr:hypothetical protein [bacterium]